jgi:hypothetical protein
MTADIKKYQKWRNHVLQMPDCRLPRRVLNYRQQGKQDLGRPQMRWSEQFV